MSDMTDKEKERQGKSAAAIEKLDQQEQSAPAPVKKKKKKKKVKEAVGTGTDNSAENAKRLGAALKERIAAADANGDKAKAADLRARLKELMATAE